MTRQLFIALAVAATALAALLVVVVPSAQSYGGPSTCTVRSSQSVAPTAKAGPFAGGDAPSTPTAAVQPATGC
jgi:hypothetical protein